MNEHLARRVLAGALDDRAIKAALGAWMPQPPRRVDRLGLQALLGAAPFKGQVQPDAGLYLAARYPARSNMYALLDAVCRQSRLPKPFEFVNSVSNAAGFQVAQWLGIDGPNLFIGAGDDAWSRLLELAEADLAFDQAGQALLLHCDEDEAGFRIEALLLAPGRPLPRGTTFAQLTATLTVDEQRL